MMDGVRVFLRNKSVATTFPIGRLERFHVGGVVGKNFDFGNIAVL